MSTDPSLRRTAVVGWFLLAVSLPFGLALEVLHGWKVRAFLESPMRRELWRLAHAHGNLLALLCLIFAANGERLVPLDSARPTVARALSIGAVLLPAGFFLGGLLNAEGDPSLGIVLVPIGGLVLLWGLVVAGRANLERESTK